MHKGVIWGGGIAALLVGAAAISETRRAANNRVELPQQAVAVIEKAPESERDALRARLEEPFKRLIEDPVMRERMAAKGRAEAEAEGRRLARAGIWMLPDSLLIERARLMDKLERRVSTEDCASIAVGAPTEGALERGLATFNGEEMTRWFAVSVESSLRALKNDPAEELIRQAEAQRLLQEAASGMPERVQAVIYQGTANATADDLCQLDLHLNRFVIDRGSPDGTGLMRFLISQSSN